MRIQAASCLEACRERRRRSFGDDREKIPDRGVRGRGEREAGGHQASMGGERQWPQ